MCMMYIRWLVTTALSVTGGCTLGSRSPKPGARHSIPLCSVSCGACGLNGTTRCSGPLQRVLQDYHSTNSSWCRRTSAFLGFGTLKSGIALSSGVTPGSVLHSPVCMAQDSTPAEQGLAERSNRDGPHTLDAG